MAQKKDSVNDFGIPVVALTDKNGNDVHVSTAGDVSQLVYGEGYTVRDFDTVQEAFDHLINKGAKPAATSAAPPATPEH